MLSIDLSGKRALVLGVADDGGFGFAISKAFAEAGAKVCVGTWPQALTVFKLLLERGKLNRSLTLSDGSKMQFERILPIDLEFDTASDLTPELKENKRYKELGDISVQNAANVLQNDFGSPCLDIVVHSVANGSEVKKPLLETSRKGYLHAVSASAFSAVSVLQRFGPLLKPGSSFLSLSYLAAERVIPGYGGGMSSAKAALESDTRVLAYEAGRKWGTRVNTISAGPYSSRAASAIGFIDEIVEYYKQNSPLSESITAAEVGYTAAFLASHLASGITGATIYVDKGYHAMGKSLT